jgi:ribosomal protein S18 acetylase RimI-like enzyme
MIAVRDIAAADRDAWRKLFLDYGTFYKASFSDEVLDGVWAWLLDDAAELRAVVATVDDRVVGFGHYRRFLDTFTAGAEWYLDDLFVDPASRGSGAATAMIEGITERAKADGGGKLRWITAADNETAQRVYDRVGYRTTWVTYEKDVS